MRKYHWLKRRYPASYLISEYSSQLKLEDRYLQDFGIRFVKPPVELIVLPEPLEERVEVRVDCQVSLGGMSCAVEVGELGLEISGNEPTEALKNKKPCIHQRFIASGNDMGHDPKYGGWINPYEGRWGQGSARKKKSYEYY